MGGSGSRWSGFKKRRQVLDRVFSSQPNLCCSSPEPLEPGGAGIAGQGSALRRRIREHLLPPGKGPAAAPGAVGATPPGRRSPDSTPSSSSASSSLSSSPQPTPKVDRAQDEDSHVGAPGRTCAIKRAPLCPAPSVWSSCWSRRRPRSPSGARRKPRPPAAARSAPATR